MVMTFVKKKLRAEVKSEKHNMICWNICHKITYAYFYMAMLKRYNSFFKLDAVPYAVKKCQNKNKILFLLKS